MINTKRPVSKVLLIIIFIKIKQVRSEIKRILKFMNCNLFFNKEFDIV
jgi:hypothetical protein